MALPSYGDRINDEIPSKPYLIYLQRFWNDETFGNALCPNRDSIAKDCKVLSRINSEWKINEQDPKGTILPPEPGAECHVIVLNYLDRHAIEQLGVLFDLEPDFFYNHYAGTEERYTGYWQPPDLIARYPLTATRLESSSMVINFRRPYLKDGYHDVWARKVDMARFCDQRKLISSLLRTYHETTLSDRVLAQERFSAVYVAKPPVATWGPTGEMP